MVTQLGYDTPGFSPMQNGSRTNARLSLLQWGHCQQSLVETNLPSGGGGRLRGPGLD